MEANLRQEALLLVDTCGERGSLALFNSGTLVSEVFLPERTASSALLGAVREILRTTGLSLAQLTGLGVVNGPGSFTGIRVGLAVVKGLAESEGLTVGSASRLAVLWQAGGLGEGLAILRAGRDETYVREVTPGHPSREFLVNSGALAEVILGRSVVYAEISLEPMLLAHAGQTTRVEVSARHAYLLIASSLDCGGEGLAELDANYVRDEGSIYRVKQVRA